MNQRILRKGDCPVSRWSGGSTAQIYLYPETGDYGKRDFLFRLSSAVIECPESDFTPLPGVERHIMMLEGTARLIYQGHGEKELLPYRPETFDGGWKTKSQGAGRDFNLMLRRGAAGGLSAQRLAPGQKGGLACQNGRFALAFLAQGGQLACPAGTLAEGDSLLLEGQGEAWLENRGAEDIWLALAWVQPPDSDREI